MSLKKIAPYSEQEFVVPRSKQKKRLKKLLADEGVAPGDTAAAGASKVRGPPVRWCRVGRGGARTAVMVPPVKGLLAWQGGRGVDGGRPLSGSPCRC